MPLVLVRNVTKGKWAWGVTLLHKWENTVTEPILFQSEARGGSHAIA